MPTYEWQGERSFKDHANDRAIDSGEVVELPERVAGPNPGFVEVATDSSDDNPGGEGTEDADASAESDESDADTQNEDADVETFTCGVEKSDGEPCGREVDGPDQKCWQHSE